MICVCPLDDAEARKAKERASRELIRLVAFMLIWMQRIDRYEGNRKNGKDPRYMSGYLIP